MVHLIHVHNYCVQSVIIKAHIQYVITECVLQLLLIEYWLNTIIWGRWTSLKYLAVICHKCGNQGVHNENIPVWTDANREWVLTLADNYGLFCLKNKESEPHDLDHPLTCMWESFLQFWEVNELINQKPFASCCI